MIAIKFVKSNFKLIPYYEFAIKLVSNLIFSLYTFWTLKFQSSLKMVGLNWLTKTKYFVCEYYVKMQANMILKCDNIFVVLKFEN